MPQRHKELELDIGQEGAKSAAERSIFGANRHWPWQASRAEKDPLRPARLLDAEAQIPGLLNDQERIDPDAQPIGDQA